jgi:hypothetical protein
MFLWVRPWVAGALALACAGCSAPMPDATAAVQPGEDSYFVMGVQPKNMMLQIDQVEADRLSAHFVHSLPPHLYGQSDGDFIVVKVKGGADYGIQSASIMAGHTMFGRRFTPCHKTLMFTVPAGKVIYVTNVEYSGDGSGRLAFHYHQDIGGARDYLAAHYPLLVGKLDQGSYRQAPFWGVGCR